MFNKNCENIEKAFKENKTFVNITCYKTSGYFSKVYVIDGNKKIIIKKIEKLLCDNGLIDLTVYILNTDKNTGLLYGSNYSKHHTTEKIEEVISFIENNQ